MSLDVDGRGYVSATAGPSVATRARRSPLLFIGIAIFALIIVLLVTQSRPADYQPLSTGNSSPDGTRALAEILRQQGVDVRQVALLGDARIADPSDTTLVIADPGYLTSAQVDSISGYPGDIVFLGITQDVLDVADAGLYLTYGADGESVAAQCTDGDAQAAGQTSSGPDAIAPEGGGAFDAVVCFSDSDGGYSYARSTTDLGSRTYLANSSVATNDELDELGNAALALRATGYHPALTWYVGGFSDTTMLTWGEAGDLPGAIEPSADFLPPGTNDVLFALGLAVLVVAVWRARRFGPLVTEPLPVIVRSSESTRGRARLYRRARATGRSTAAMRGLVALRIGKRLGVPRAAGKAGLLQAISRATGRSPGDVEMLLYGPAPGTEAEMMTLVERLDQLESEVHRP